jgi:hypothetical protein
MRASFHERKSVFRIWWVARADSWFQDGAGSGEPAKAAKLFHALGEDAEIAAADEGCF